jgi:hypothetical protein
MNALQDGAPTVEAGDQSATKTFVWKNKIEELRKKK